MFFLPYFFSYRSFGVCRDLFLTFRIFPNTTCYFFMWIFEGVYTLSTASHFATVQKELLFEEVEAFLKELQLVLPKY